MPIRHLTISLIIASVAVVLFAPESCFAQQAAPRSGIKVMGVRVEGERLADPGLILANSGLVVGKEITGEDIQRAIRRIWRLGLFKDVEILLEREVPGGGFFVIKVEEFPRIAQIEISGNRKIKDDEALELLDLYRGQVMRPAKLQAARRNLLDEYKEKGYLLATVEIEAEDTDDPLRKKIRFVIDEGRKVRIEEINFVGNEAFEDKTLRKQFEETEQRGWFILSWFTTGDFDRSEYEDDLDRLVSFYRNQGYRDAEVVSDSISYTRDLSRMILTIRVREGIQYYFGDVEFAGNKIFTENQLLDRLAFRPGDVYSEEKLQLTTGERLGNLYYDRGYIYSSIEPLLVPAAKDTLDVTFQIHEGNQFTVRKIHILGNTKTKDKVIRREMVLFPGETFDVSLLRRSVRELTILNYFANVTPDVQPVSDSEVDLYVEVEEKPTDQANVSAGYSERDGVIGAIGFAMPNFLGNGQRFSLDWNFGRIYRSFSISFTEPWMFNTPTLGGISFFDLRRGGSFYGFDEHVSGASFRLGRRFRWPDDYTRGDWIYRIDRAEYDNFTRSFRENNPRALEEGRIRWSSSLTQIFTRDSRDNPEFPTRGSVFSYSTELTGRFLGGDDEFLKHRVSGEWYTPLYGKLTLYSHTLFGVLYELGDARDVPYIDYFFMGGSGISFGESLRGYEEGDVGPQAGGYPIGGQSMFKQTMEIRLPVIPNPTVFVLGFAEAGNTWASRGQTNLNDLRRSVGLGVRLYMPFIGLIGLDYGYGFDYVGDQGRREGRWVPHFQFGRTF
ncbi:MAG: Outer membrane protein assembly factor BamA [Calditrichaeota bacterium]|nr:Outer membrane protein assembly factor BamA [Calditrichota bacterium]